MITYEFPISKERREFLEAAFVELAEALELYQSPRLKKVIPVAFFKPEHKQDFAGKYEPYNYKNEVMLNCEFLSEEIYGCQYYAFLTATRTYIHEVAHLLTFAWFDNHGKTRQKPEHDWRFFVVDLALQIRASRLLASWNYSILHYWKDPQLSPPLPLNNKPVPLAKIRFYNFQNLLIAGEVPISTAIKEGIDYAEYLANSQLTPWEITDRVFDRWGIILYKANKSKDQTERLSKELAVVLASSFGMAAAWVGFFRSV